MSEKIFNTEPSNLNYKNIATIYIYMNISYMYIVFVSKKQECNSEMELYSPFWIVFAM